MTGLRLSESMMDAENGITGTMKRKTSVREEPHQGRTKFASSNV